MEENRTKETSKRLPAVQVLFEVENPWVVLGLETPDQKEEQGKISAPTMQKKKKNMQNFQNTAQLQELSWLNRGGVSSNQRFLSRLKEQRKVQIYSNLAGSTVQVGLV